MGIENDDGTGGWSMRPSALQQGSGLAVFILVCFAAAGVGGFVTTPNIPTWYASLAKPIWTPPDWVFGPVWTLLYAAMAVAAWLVWRQGSPERRSPLTAWGVQLILNTLWSWIFFGLHRPDLAAVEIGLLWVAILVTVVLFWRVRPVAGALLLPYLAWVSFAAVLNVTLWLLNR